MASQNIIINSVKLRKLLQGKVVIICNIYVYDVCFQKQKCLARWFFKKSLLIDKNTLIYNKGAEESFITTLVFCVLSCA